MVVAGDVQLINFGEIELRALIAVTLVLLTASASATAVRRPTLSHLNNNHYLRFRGGGRLASDSASGELNSKDKGAAAAVATTAAEQQQPAAAQQLRPSAVVAAADGWQ